MTFEINHFPLCTCSDTHTVYTYCLKNHQKPLSHPAIKIASNRSIIQAKTKHNQQDLSLFVVQFHRNNVGGRLCIESADKTKKETTKLRERLHWIRERSGFATPFKNKDEHGCVFTFSWEVNLRSKQKSIEKGNKDNRTSAFSTFVVLPLWFSILMEWNLNNVNQDQWRSEFQWVEEGKDRVYSVVYIDFNIWIINNYFERGKQSNHGCYHG